MLLELFVPDFYLPLQIHMQVMRKILPNRIKIYDTYQSFLPRLTKLANMQNARKFSRKIIYMWVLKRTVSVSFSLMFIYFFSEERGGWALVVFGY